MAEWLFRCSPFGPEPRFIGQRWSLSSGMYTFVRDLICTLYSSRVGNFRLRKAKVSFHACRDRKMASAGLISLVKSDGVLSLRLVLRCFLMFPWCVRFRFALILVVESACSKSKNSVSDCMG